jgi:hypothetical protein
MKCQSFPFFGVLFALALNSLHAAGETALDTATIEAISGLKGVSNQTEGTRWLKFCRGEKHLWFPPASKLATAS